MKKADDKPSDKLENVFEEEEENICQACGGPLKLEKVNLEEFEGGKLYLMENVAAYVCGNCSEMWVPEPILKEFEKMMDTAKHHKTQSPKRRVK